MPWMTELWLRLRGLVWRERLDRDLDAELKFHMQMRQREFEESGMAPAEARHAARRRFGNDMAVREIGRELFGFGPLERLWQDIRHGWRLLFKTPGVTLIAILSLALGIGGNTTIFSVIYAVLLKPPLYTNPEEIVMIWGADLASGRNRNMVAFADLLDWQKQSRSFRDLAASGIGSTEATMVAGETPERVRWQSVSPNLFQLLGVKPILGRDLNDPAFYRASRGILLSYEFWQRRFGADPSVTSRSMNLNGHPVPVAGVMPKGFQVFSSGKGTDIWQALDPENLDQQSRAIPWLLGVGRLATDVTLAEAEAELSGIAKQLEQAYPDTNKNRGVLIQPLQAWTSGARNALLPLAGAVTFVLLMACANVANLLLARAGARQKELVVRSALGAGRWRLIRQLLTESLLLAVLGGIAGLGLAWFGVRLFQLLAPAWFPQYVEIGLNGPVALFTLAVSVLAGILAGLAPAVQASRTNLNESLKEGTRASFTRGRKRTSAALVAVQVALALVLVAGAGLMINTLTRLLRVDLGYDPSKLITMQIDLSGSSYMEIIKQRKNAVRRIEPRVQVIYDRVLERVQALPGVQSASLVAWVPQAGNNVGPRVRRIHIQGQPAARPGEESSAFYNVVEPDYFTTTRIRLLRGRLLSDRDILSASWVIVINETAGKRFFPNGDALGQLITIRTVGSEEQEHPREVVGIVGDVRQYSLAREAHPEIYAPYAQQPLIYGDGWQMLLHRNLVVRTTGDPEHLATTVRNEVISIDRNQPVYGLKTMQEIVSSSTGPWRFYLNLLSIFSGIALFLAAIGIYGVISHAVGERRYEFGIRMAVGGAPRHIWKLVFREGLLVVGIGLAAGLIASTMLTPLIGVALYGVKPQDPLTFACAAIVLSIVACAAIIQPARKATRIDPARALRAS